jgi:23S rRNA-/tRNA-specific pseudouridylate synthase
MKKTTKKEVGLLDYLKQMFPNSSTNTIRKMLSQGRVEVNKKITHKAKHQLLPGDTVELLDKPQREVKEQTEIKFKNYSIDLIYEDDQILIVEKPAKLLSVATDRLEQDTLHSKCVDYLKDKDAKAWAYIVHRLDKETSGVMMLAKTKSSKDYLQEQFSRREVYRIYHTLVEGLSNWRIWNHNTIPYRR